MSRTPLWWLLGLLAGAYALLCAGLFLFQRSLIYYPQGRAITAPESTMTLPVEGAELVVTVRPHSGSKAILYFGGNGEDVSNNLPTYAQAFPQHALYFMHYRGYGGSSGKPSEQANIRDAITLFEAVHAQHGDVTVIGRSLGSGVAVQLASQQPVSRLILVTPYDSLEAIAASRFPYAPIQWLLIDKYDSGKYAPAIKVPTTLLAAERDTVIPQSSTLQLLARFAHGVASIKIIPGTGHNSISESAEYLASLKAAL